MKKLFWINGVVMILFSGAVMAQAWGDGPFGYPSDSRQYRQFLEDTKEKHGLIYGYYPDFFSDKSRPRYWLTPEEEGHYIAGFTQKPFPTLPDMTMHKEPLVPDSTGILMSVPSNIPSEEKIPPVKSQSDEEKKPRINDSQDLDRVIKEHIWITPDWVNQ